MKRRLRILAAVTAAEAVALAAWFYAVDRQLRRHTQTTPERLP